MNRREFSKLSIAMASGMTISASDCYELGERMKKPNVLIIMCDQMQASALMVISRKAKSRLSAFKRARKVWLRAWRVVSIHVSQTRVLVALREDV